MVSGLTDKQVEEKIALGEVNKVNHKTKTLREVFITNLFSKFNIFFFAVIAVLIIFYIKTGEIKLMLDGWGIFSLVFVNTVIAIVQEIRAKKMLDKVELLINRDICVVRNSVKVNILPEKLVKGDVIFVERGDQIPADGFVVESTRLEIDESLLTGESEPMIKKNGDNLLSGSFVSSGNGYFTADKLGGDSYAGKITGMAKNFKYISSPLQNKILKIIQVLSITAVFLIIIKAVDNKSIGILSVDGIRQYTTIIISLVPQGLVFLTTITYIVGIYRISQLGGIVQKINAIEAFSGINTVFMDKTGTLTQNKLSVTNLINLTDESIEDVKKLLGTYAKYSSYKNSTLNSLCVYDFEKNGEVIDELPFSSQTKQSAIKVNINGEIRIFLLGALDILSQRIDQKSKSRINEDEIKLFRNLLFIEVFPSNLQNDLNVDIKQGEIKPICVISLLDTIREDSREALDLFEAKNIDVKILSGDSPYAIQAIASKVGWDISDDMLISGPELAEMDEHKFKQAVLHKKIFARLAPEQKKEIIGVFKKKKIFTAMIGDGVNDLPAIKSSDLGIAMEEGSQVTKEVADIILVKNKFSLLPQIFDEGNRIVNSVSMAAKLFLTKNLSVTIIILLTVLTTLPFLLTPRKVSFLNIFIITLPSFLISIYNKDISRRKKFIKDLFTAVSISAVFVVVFGYVAYYLSPDYYKNITEESRIGIFLCVIVYITVANYLSVVIPSHAGAKEKILFSLYSASLMLILYVMTVVDLAKTPLFWFKELYEVPTLNKEYWIFITIMGLTGGGLLYLLQKLRRLLIKTDETF
ncbi:MAG: HAD-IC family P-type ATPase [bacterium]